MGRSLAILGVPGVMGKSYPKSVTDDFSADSGLWLDGNLNPAAMTISSGRGIWTPTVGNEIIIKGDFSAWTGDNPDGWTVATESLPDYEVSEVGTGEGHGGSGTGLCNLYRNGAGYLNINQGTNVTAGGWYRISLVIDTIVSGSLELHNANGMSQVFTSTGAKLYTAVNWGIGSSWRIQAAANPTDITIDDVSLKSITFATIFRLRRIYYASYVEAAIRRSAVTQKGVVLFKDANNMIMVWDNGNNVIYLRKRVAGTWGTASSGSFTYSAGGTMRLVPNTSFNAFSVTYDGVQKIAPVSITDFAADMNANGLFNTPWYAGIITSYDSGNIDSDAFDNFAAVSVF